MHSILRPAGALLAFVGGSPKLIVSVLLLALLFSFGSVGSAFVDTELAQPISVKTNQPPSMQHLLGTDSGGRDVLAVMVVGTPQTLRMGVLAGLIGVVFGVFLGLVSGFFGGPADRIISAVTDTPIIVYPNSGETYDPVGHCWRGESAPAEFGTFSREWRKLGAALIGGCCRTTPAHIRQISDRFRKATIWPID